MFKRIFVCILIVTTSTAFAKPPKTFRFAPAVRNLGDDWVGPNPDASCSPLFGANCTSCSNGVGFYWANARKVLSGTPPTYDRCGKNMYTWQIGGTYNIQGGGWPGTGFVAWNDDFQLFCMYGTTWEQVGVDAVRAQGVTCGTSCTVVSQMWTVCLNRGYTYKVVMSSWPGQPYVGNPLATDDYLFSVP